jgi:hypothetical protein
MAEIGDYIHYRLINYQKYGITHRDKQSTSGTSQANAAFAQQKQAIKKFLDSKKLPLSDIESRLNEMQGFLTGTNASVSNSKSAKILKEFVEEFKTKLGGEATSVDYNTLTMYANSGFSDAQYETIVKKHSEDLKKFKNNKLSVGTGTHKIIRKETVIKRLRALNQIKRTLINDLQKPAQATELISLINQINAKYIELHTEFNKHGGQLPRNFAGLSGSKNGLLTLINQAFTEIRRKQIPNESGKLAELMAAVCLSQNTLQAGMSVKDAVAKFIKDIEGSATHNKAYITSNFGSMEFTQGKTTETVTVKLPGTGITANVTTDIKHKGQQGKIDFRFEYKDSDNQIKDVGISHKAYFLNNEPNIHINSGSNLLFMMQEYPEFSNHYLNVMASHPDPEAANLSNARTLAKEALKLTILAYSLSGGFVTDRGKMDKAEVLTVFNKSTGKYKAFSINSILNRAAENVDRFLDLDKDSSLGELPNNGNNSQVRIANMLAQLRAASIKASIKKEALGYK